MQTLEEWPRTREVLTERYLVDMHGLSYELSPLGWLTSTWGLRPISQHLRVIPDFDLFKGLLVLGGNQVISSTFLAACLFGMSANWYALQLMRSEMGSLLS